MESKHLEVNSLDAKRRQFGVLFVGEVELVKQQKCLNRHDVGQLKARKDWKMRVDLGKQLIVPQEIVTTNLKSDLLLWSEAQHLV